jgi:tetratricopeptide (TPR) repeat protein
LQALWSTSFIYQRIGWLEENLEKKKQMYLNAITYADKTYRKYPGTYEANIVKAGSMARMSEFLSAKERVHAAWDIKKYGEAALQLNPDNPEVWYLLGWLNFELSRANWMERSLAGLLFGGLPGDMTMEKGIRYMEKANELKPDCIVYLYDLATFYERSEDTDTAIRLTKKALALQPVAPEDFIYHKKLQNLLYRLNS